MTADLLFFILSSIFIFMFILITLSIFIVKKIQKKHPNFKFWKSFWNKIKKIFNWKIKFKRKSKQNNISPQSN